MHSSFYSLFITFGHFVVAFAASTNITPSSLSALPITTSKPSSCDACAYDYDFRRGPWGGDFFTYTAAIVEIIVDNATNITSTATVQQPDFTPSVTADGGIITITSDLAIETLGSTFSLTYPTSYELFYNFSISSQTLSTIKGNGTSTIVCTDVHTTYTDAFAIPQQTGVQGGEISGTAANAYSSFLASAFPGCEDVGGVGLAEPKTKVAVSALTGTTTKHVSGKYTAVPITQSAGDSEVTITSGEYYLPSGAMPSGPVVHHTVTGGLGPVTTVEPESEGDDGGNGDENDNGDITLPFFGPIGPGPTTIAIPDSGNQPGIAIPIKQSEEPVSPTPSPAQITVGGRTYTADTLSQFYVGSQTLAAGDPAVTQDGHTLSLGPSANAVIIDGSTTAITQPLSNTDTIDDTSSKPLGNIIMGGFGPSTTASEAGSTNTGPVTFTGDARSGKNIRGVGAVLLGVAAGLLMIRNIY